MLYRVSLEKEDIKFCTVASDKLPIAGKDHKDKVTHQPTTHRATHAGAASAHDPLIDIVRRRVLCLLNEYFLGATQSALGHCSPTDLTQSANISSHAGEAGFYNVSERKASEGHEAHRRC